MDVQIKHNGTDISNKVISYTRTGNICTGVATANLNTHIYSGIDFHTWDEITLYEEGDKMAQFFVTSASKNAKTGVLSLALQDNSKLLMDMYLTEIYTVGANNNARYWINKLMAEAGVTVNYTMAGTGAVLDPEESFGPGNAYDLLIPMLQRSGWYFYIDPDGEAVVGKAVKKASRYDVLLNEQNVLSVVEVEHDRMLRNRAVVWGSANRITQDWAFADVSKDTPWNYDSQDRRAVVLSLPNLTSKSSAGYMANTLLKEFAQINHEITVEVAGVYGVFPGDLAFLDYRYYRGTGTITTVSVSMSRAGLITTLILNERCPRLFGFYEPDGEDYVYIGTDHMGVWRKPLNGSLWTDYSAGLTESGIRDLIVNNGVLACVTSGGMLFHRTILDSSWTPFVTSGFGNELGEFIPFSGLRAVACDIDRYNNHIFSVFNQLDSGSGRSWVVELGPLGNSVATSQVVVSGEPNLGAIDLDHNEREVIVSAVVSGDFLPIIDIPAGDDGNFGDPTNTHSQVGIVDGNQFISLPPATGETGEAEATATVEYTRSTGSVGPNIVINNGPDDQGIYTEYDPNGRYLYRGVFVAGGFSTHPDNGGIYSQQLPTFAGSSNLLILAEVDSDRLVFISESAGTLYWGMITISTNDVTTFPLTTLSGNILSTVASNGTVSILHGATTSSISLTVANAYTLGYSTQEVYASGAPGVVSMAYGISAYDDQVCVPILRYYVEDSSHRLRLTVTPFIANKDTTTITPGTEAELFNHTFSGTVGTTLANSLYMGQMTFFGGVDPDTDAKLCKDIGVRRFTYFDGGSNDIYLGHNLTLEMSNGLVLDFETDYDLYSDAVADFTRTALPEYLTGYAARRMLFGTVDRYKHTRHVVLDTHANRRPRENMSEFNDTYPCLRDPYTLQILCELEVPYTTVPGDTGWWTDTTANPKSNYAGIIMGYPVLDDVDGNLYLLIDPRTSSTTGGAILLGYDTQTGSIQKDFRTSLGARISWLFSTSPANLADLIPAYKRFMVTANMAVFEYFYNSTWNRSLLKFYNYDYQSGYGGGSAYKVLKSLGWPVPAPGTSGSTFENIYTAPFYPRLEGSQSSHLVVFDTPMASGANSGGIASTFSYTLSGFNEVVPALIPIFDVRSFSIPGSGAVAVTSGNFDQSGYGPFIAVATSGNLLIVDGIFFDQAKVVQTFSGIVSHVEVSNIGDSPYLFTSISGIVGSGDQFFQRNPFMDTFTDYSATLPSGHITVIRADDQL